MGAVAVDDLAEEALADHVQHGQVVATETPVLEHHTGNAGGLVRFHQIPTFVKGQRTGDLDRHIFAGLHRGDGHLGVPLPGRGDDDGVEIGAFQQTHVILFAASIQLGLRAPQPRYEFLGT